MSNKLTACKQFLTDFLVSCILYHVHVRVRPSVGLSVGWNECRLLFYNVNIY